MMCRKFCLLERSAVSGWYTTIGLPEKIRQYEENKTTVTYMVCAKEMAEMKKTEAYTFLREVDSVALQQSLRHLDQLYLR